jgi:tetratricopeptide (TPR) repeat protein
VRTPIALLLSFALVGITVTASPALAQPEPKTAREFLERGNKALKNDEFLNASRDFSEAISLDPKNARAYSGRGLARVRLGWIERGVEDFNEAIKLDPNYAPAYHGRGIAVQAEGKPLLAVTDYTEAIKLDPKSAETYRDRASAHLAMKGYEKAIEDATEAIRLDPKLAVAYHTRASALYRKGTLDKALADLNEAVQLDPKNAGFYLDRSQCRVRLGTDLAAALKDADEAIRLDPKNPMALGQRVIVRFAQAEWGEGRKDLDEAIRLGPNIPDLYIARANLLACCPDPKFHDLKQALKDADRACELTEWKDPYAIEALAAAAAAMGDFVGAVKWQKQALENPAYAASPQGKLRLASYEAKRVIRYAPPIRDRTDAREFVTRGNHYYTNGEYDNALRDFDEAVRLDPKNAKAYYGRACARTRLDQDVKALADFSEAIKLDPKDVSSFVDRSVLHAHRGEWQLAIDDCDSALKIDPKYVAAITNRAMIRATCVDQAFRDATKALKDARQACDLTGWKAGYPLEGYAAACAEAGDFEEAVKWQSRAATDEDYFHRNASSINYRLQLYQSKKPLRMGSARKLD